MLPMQTWQIILGIAVAVLYGGAVLATGMLVVMAIVPHAARTAIRAQGGRTSLVWLGFVLGQGCLGVGWLALSLAGLLYAQIVWGFCAAGWILGAGMLWVRRRDWTETVQQAWTGLRSCLQSRSWYLWIGIGVGVLMVFRGIMVLLPPSVADALWVYLPSARVIAFSHTLTFQPFNSPHNGLYPLQVDIHWAALFTMSNETAIQGWDYLCAFSSLSGIGLLAWWLTSDKRVALVAMLMMFSTPGFYDLMGGAKPDNAAVQYGMAACVWLLCLPCLGRRAMICAGLCAGWAVASRYTNVILLPALLVFFVMSTVQGGALSRHTLRESLGLWGSHVLVGALAVGVAMAPMVLKNWLLVGCPLAPHIGCQEMSWANIYGAPRQNLEVADLLVYPFVWTFARRADMLGNISPLFLGSLPFLLLTYRTYPLVRSTHMAGVAGLVSLATWLLLEPLILFTRWLLVPLAFCTIPCSAALVALEHELRSARAARWLMRGAFLMMLFFLLFQSRTVVHAVRYIAAIDQKATRYAAEPYYDVATWLNAHVQPGQRVGLRDYGNFFHFLQTDILLRSETAEESQWLWQHWDSLSMTEIGDFYARRGFTYVVMEKDRMPQASSWPLHDGELRILFVGQKKMVGRIEKSPPAHGS